MQKNDLIFAAHKYVPYCVLVVWVLKKAWKHSPLATINIKFTRNILIKRVTAVMGLSVPLNRNPLQN